MGAASCKNPKSPTQIQPKDDNKYVKNFIYQFKISHTDN